MSAITKTCRDALQLVIAKTTTHAMSLHHALVAGLAAIDAGSYGHLAPEYRRCLEEHTGGWFGASAAVRELLLALDEQVKQNENIFAPPLRLVCREYTPRGLCRGELVFEQFNRLGSLAFLRCQECSCGYEANAVPKIGVGA